MYRFISLLTNYLELIEDPNACMRAYACACLCIYICPPKISKEKRIPFFNTLLIGIMLK